MVCKWPPPIGVDLAIVDRMLPKLDGLALVQSLRATGRKIPVLILSALGDVDDRITGLRAGGDDYLTKPYHMSELLARIDALAGAERATPRKPHQAEAWRTWNWTA
jgi:two-component system OmpR family response regulator